ncbi:glycosyltransferase family 9 protein [Dongshaea marina]|uniref:glycosyltransferase family 9 protein n=1 Tax=Dongshaea marina TaxID=2047966 RepID=UPI000D3ED226|nr:glycosyltransferase family 9 protein [Dongshaea marina]
MNHLWTEQRGLYVSKKAKQYLANFDPKSVKKIAVIRHAAFGDMVITRAFLVEARRFFPNAEITLSVVTNYCYSAPEDLVDRMHYQYGTDPEHRKKGIYERACNMRELGEQDIIFDLAATNRSSYLMLLSKAKLKIGFPYLGIQQRLLYDLAIPRPDQLTELDCMLSMLTVLGHLPQNPPNYAYPDHRLVDRPEKAYVVYFNGASLASKRYPNELTYKLIELSARVLPEYQHVFLEGIKKDERGDFLQGLVKSEKNVSIQATMPLDDLTSYLAKASVVVSPDTGVRNLAICTHTPTVGIFYSTVPFRYWPRYEPGHIVVINSDGSKPQPEQVLHELNTALVASKSRATAKPIGAIDSDKRITA